MWGDETFTVSVISQSPAEIIRTVQSDIHPPLYFLLAHWWNQLPIGSDPLVRLRLLSVVFAILTTIFIERTWLKTVSDDVRDWFLPLWVFSPVLLLYDRMARSYSLQILLSAIAIWFAIRFVENPAPKFMAALVVSLTALLYTHYLPGIAIWAGLNVLLFSRRRAWLILNVLVAAAYLPWLITLGGALSRWQHKETYNLTGNAWLEQIVKLGYWFYSFAFGEAIPLWLLPVTILLALPCFWLVYSGARIHRVWVAPTAVAAVVGYLGAARWVSYPFMGARLLFLLPVFLLTMAAGIVSKKRLGMILGIVLFLANLGGIWGYFGAWDILNAGYITPNQEIAREIVLHSSPENTVVWIDGLNIDGSTLQYYLSKTFPIRILTTPETIAAAQAELQNGNIHHVWFIRNTHDISAGHAFSKLEQEMSRTWYNRTLHPYVPLSPTHRAILRAIAMLHHEDMSSPRYMYEVWEFKN